MYILVVAIIWKQVDNMTVSVTYVQADYAFEMHEISVSNQSMDILDPPSFSTFLTRSVTF